MTGKKNNDKIQKDIIICRCEEVRLSEIRSAIDKGARTVEEVKKLTRAGMGLCQSKTCFPLIASIIFKETGIPIDEILPSKQRFPSRPLELKKFDLE
jgi:NAD(P)H-nitrite reductase large subunit